MKTAFILTGYFRTFDYVKNTLMAHVIEPLNCDVFFSTPKTMFALPENEVSEFHELHSQNLSVVDPAFFGTFLKSYQITNPSAQVYKDIITQTGIPQKNIFNQLAWRILSQMHGVSLSLQVFKKYIEQTNTNYDLVIMTRGDIKYHTTFDTSKVLLDKINYPLHSLNDGKFNTVDSCPSPSLNKPFNDQIIVGSQKNILSFQDIFEKVINYSKEGIHFNPETLYGIHAQRKGLDFLGTDFVRYELWRHSKH
jgi:hypothetical protein